MNTDRLFRYLFLLAALFIVVVFYVGTVNVGGTFLDKFTSLYYAITGRNAQGVVANYPTTQAA